MQKHEKKISNDFLDALTDRIKVSKTIHKSWYEIDNSYISPVGKFIYYYSNSNGTISLVKLRDYMSPIFRKYTRGNIFVKKSKLNSLYLWELMCCVNPFNKLLFQGSMRFSTKKEAENFIETKLKGRIK